MDLILRQRQNGLGKGKGQIDVGVGVGPAGMTSDCLRRKPSLLLFQLLLLLHCLALWVGILWRKECKDTNRQRLYGQQRSKD
jgi:hypothetical protein